MTITWVVPKVLTPTKGHEVGALEFKQKLPSERGRGEREGTQEKDVEGNLNETRIVSFFLN